MTDKHKLLTELLVERHGLQEALDALDRQAQEQIPKLQELTGRINEIVKQITLAAVQAGSEG